MAEPDATPVLWTPLSTGALNPTQVIPGPRPVERAESDEAKVISGEVVGPRHARRRRRGSRGALGTAALLSAATGGVAGLSLLLSPQPSAQPVASQPADPAPVVLPDSQAPVADQPAAPPPAAPPAVAAHGVPTGQSRAPATAQHLTSVQPATAVVRTAGARRPAVETAADTTARTTPRTAARHPSAGSGRHARLPGPWKSADWQEAVRQATAGSHAGHSHGQGRPHGQARSGGRHRADNAGRDGAREPDVPR